MSDTPTPATRDVGFLGPDFLGLGLFSELPERIDKAAFLAWLDDNRREHHGDQYRANDLLFYELHLPAGKVRN